jgi:hypothetical protein
MSKKIQFNAGQWVWSDNASIADINSGDFILETGITLYHIGIIYSCCPDCGSLVEMDSFDGPMHLYYGFSALDFGRPPALFSCRCGCMWGIDR